ncbi:hypothetical protein Ccrd_003519 [Cynara cardunculus var. scolymus]|uniref:Oxoglutarate/iron-dependent dioxygenase n=1 Tax=Cynara cardunculus var. scolymus TaxID=59895 RepID=A0A124SCP7_CYNCS|nr:hypothetical protein Ccrd_003519 [Cynara cardunculus var. scolymus]
MAPAAGVSSVTDLAPAVHPSAMSETFAKNAIISWFRGEFAAANAIIDSLCGHLSRLDGGRCEYESVFAAIHRRRLNWIPILQMQKYFSIADVTLELQKVTEEKTKLRGSERIEEVDVSSPVKLEKQPEILEMESTDSNRNGGAEADDDDTRLSAPTSEITDTGSEEVQPLVETVKICSNQEDLEAWRAQIRIRKGFVAKESVKGHMASLKLYENILGDTELTRLIDYVHKLRVASRNGELSGETFITYNQQLKTIKREAIQFGTPIFGQIRDETTGVINHLIKYHLITENRRPNSCIINFFDEGEFSQPFLKPPHLDQPISVLFLSESTMAFGRTLACDKDGNYRGPLMLPLKEGADMARNVMCQSPTKRINISFFRVRIDSNDEKTSSATATDDAMTVWQPGVPTPKGTTLNGYDSMDKVSKWGAPQLLMLAPVRPMVMSPRRLPRGGTGVFFPWNKIGKICTSSSPKRTDSRTSSSTG